MCGFHASKCADVVRQNVMGIVRRNVRVRCVKVCAYKYQNGAMGCVNGAMVCDNGATQLQRNGDYERRQIDKIELYLRTVVIFNFKKPAFQSVALICIIKTGM